jgi:tetratricopeptide (TPR) repeat protein
MGNTYMQIADYDKALKAYQKCVEIDGEDALTLSYLAEAYERLEQFEEAMHYYNKAKEINPELAEPWLGIGIILELQGDANQAINYLSQAVRLQPENSNYRLVLGEAFYNAGRMVEAETELERALQLDPKYSDAILLLAKIKSEFNEGEALDFLLNLEHLSELEPKIRILLVTLLWKSGQKTQALLNFKKEYLLDKESAKTLFLYLPEAEFIPDFMAIIDTENE